MMEYVYKSADLGPEERATVERLFGRKLECDEIIRVTAHRNLEDDIHAKDLGVREQPGPDGFYEAERHSLDERETPERRRRRELAVDHIRELRRGITLGEDLNLKDLVNAGRRM
jgi:hypothetical protein